ncbi:MAG: NAD(P)/FAD-dependent oxidoreductase [Calditrichia bacterium]
MNYDAVVIGSGPNGLAAGITLARRGLSVLIAEAKDSVGGGMRSAELTLPGFVHDVCSAIHALGAGSSFLKTLPLGRYGLEWITPPSALAHPFEDSAAAVLDVSTVGTGKTLMEDEISYRKLMNPLVNNWEKLASDILGPLKIPRHLLLSIGFALLGFQSAEGFSQRHFSGGRSRSFFAGLAAHSMMPLEQRLTAGVGLVLGILGHVTGWPFPRGGSQKFADALAAYFESLGGKIELNRPINSLADLPAARAILFDVTPRQLLKITGDRFPARYRRQLENYRYNPGVFKIDWALSGPVPFKAMECRQAGTIHIGGSYDEIADSERTVWQGKHPERPFVLFAQQSLFDKTRAPDGKHTGWAYCHVPHGSTEDMTAGIEDQIERFAPGFRDCILERHTMNTADMEAYNANYIGGDINGGVQDWRQLFARPALRSSPYSTPLKGIYICSSSTPPGGGVHGLCGYHAAGRALRDMFRGE